MHSYTKVNTVYPLAARTAPYAPSPVQVNNGYRGLRADINVDAIAGAAGATLVLTIQRQEPTGGDWVDVVATAGLTAAGNYVLTISQNIPAAANANAQTILPRLLRVTAGGTSTGATFGVAFTWSD